MAREGGQGFFLKNMLKGDGMGKGLIFFRVGLIHFILWASPPHLAKVGLRHPPFLSNFRVGEVLPLLIT